MNKTFQLSALSSVLLLSACGGDGSSDNSNDDNTGTPPPTPNYTVSAEAGEGGSIDPSSAVVDEGDTTSFNVTPSEGFLIDTVSGCNGSLDGNTYTTGAITADCTVEASFSEQTFTVTTTTNEFGDISPGSQEVTYGDTAEFNLTPDEGYAIDSVTGCGGSLSDMTYTTGAITQACEVSATFSEIESSDPVLVANDDYEVGYANERFMFEVAKNDEYLGDGELSITVDGFNEGIFVAEVTNVGLRINGTLSSDFVGTGTIDYTITDGTYSDSATVYVDITEKEYDADTVSIVGHALADGTISAQVGGERYEAQAEPDGNYQLGPISAPETPSGDMIRVIAQGTAENDEAHVEYSALFGDFETILETSAGDGLLYGEDSFTNLSAITTAEDVLISRLAGSETFSAQELADYRAGLDTLALIRMAGAISLVATGDHPLPEQYDTVREFALDKAAFDSFMESVATDIHPEFEELLNDPYATLTDIPYGYYVGAVTGNPTIGVDSRYGFAIGVDSETNGISDKISMTLSGQGGFAPEIWEGTYEAEPIFSEVDGTSGSSFSANLFRDYQANTYPSIYEGKLDSDVTDAMKAYFNDLRLNKQEMITITHSRNWVDGRVLTNDGINVSMLHDVEIAYEPWSFEWEGTTYDIPRVVYLTYENVTMRMSDARDYASGKGEFNFADNPTWVLPIKGKSVYADAITPEDFDPAYVQWGGSDLVNFSGGETSGSFTGTYLDVTGTWSLNDARNRLTLNYSINGNDIRIKYWLHATGSVNTSAVVSIDISTGNSEPLNQINNVQHWQVARITPYMGPDPSLFSELAPDKPLAFFYMPHPGGWAEGDPVVSSTTQFTYLNSDGTIDNVEVFCGSQSIYAVSNCPASEVNVNVTDNTTAGANRVWSERSDGSFFFANENYPTDADEFFEPLAIDNESGAVLMLKYRPNSQSNCTVDSCPLESYPSLRIYKGMDEVTVN